MNFVEMWWLSVPFALVLCLILSWLSTGDDDINYHESTVMRVSLREFHASITLFLSLSLSRLG